MGPDVSNLKSSAKAPPALVWMPRLVKISVSAVKLLVFEPPFLASEAELQLPALAAPRPVPAAVELLHVSSRSSGSAASGDGVCREDSALLFADGEFGENGSMLGWRWKGSPCMLSTFVLPDTKEKYSEKAPATPLKARIFKRHDSKGKIKGID